MVLHILLAGILIKMNNFLIIVQINIGNILDLIILHMALKERLDGWIIWNYEIQILKFRISSPINESTQDVQENVVFFA